MNKQGKFINYNMTMELFYNSQTFAKLNDGETVYALKAQIIFILCFKMK